MEEYQSKTNACERSPGDSSFTSIIPTAMVVFMIRSYEQPTLWSRLRTKRCGGIEWARPQTDQGWKARVFEFELRAVVNEEETLSHRPLRWIRRGSSPSTNPHTPISEGYFKQRALFKYVKKALVLGSDAFGQKASSKMSTSFQQNKPLQQVEQYASCHTTPK